MKNKKLFRLVLGAIFTSLIMLATFIIKIPSFGTSGYINLGDSIILITVWTLGGFESILACGLGSILADLFAGYAAYIPGTFIIKSVMACSIILTLYLTNKFKCSKTIKLILSAILCEIIMVIGYFIFESLFIVNSIGAISNIMSNTIQAISNVIIAVILYLPLQNFKIINNLK